MNPEARILSSARPASPDDTYAHPCLRMVTIKPSRRKFTTRSHTLPTVLCPSPYKYVLELVFWSPVQVVLFVAHARQVEDRLEYMRFDGLTTKRLNPRQLRVQGFEIQFKKSYKKCPRRLFKLFVVDANDSDLVYYRTHPFEIYARRRPEEEEFWNKRVNAQNSAPPISHPGAGAPVLGPGYDAPLRRTHRPSPPSSVPRPPDSPRALVAPHDIPLQLPSTRDRPHFDDSESRRPPPPPSAVPMFQPVPPSRSSHQHLPSGEYYVTPGTILPIQLNSLPPPSAAPLPPPRPPPAPEYDFSNYGPSFPSDPEQFRGQLFRSQMVLSVRYNQQRPFPTTSAPPPPSVPPPPLPRPSAILGPDPSSSTTSSTSMSVEGGNELIASSFVVDG